jgi:hypothetical protein
MSTDALPLLLQVQPAEVTTLVGAFADSSSLAMSGIKLGGVKYMYLRGDAGRSIYGRKVQGNNPYGTYACIFCLL